MLDSIGQQLGSVQDIVFYIIPLTLSPWEFVPIHHSSAAPLFLSNEGSKQGKTLS